MSKKDFKAGEKVFAKWPGSTKYYEAVIDAVSDGEYVVSFSEGSLTAAIEQRHVFVSSSKI